MLHIGSDAAGNTQNPPKRQPFPRNNRAPEAWTPTHAILFPGRSRSRAKVVEFSCVTTFICARIDSGSESALRRPAMNDNEERPVTTIVGRVWRKKGGDSEGVHIMLVAPDDDSAVRRALEALAKEGYAEAELDQIGDMEGAPDDEPHLSAWQGATEGEVSIVTFDEPF
jgi:hypothetical protein